ncbi:DUF4893 domain-containing protein [Paracoccus luteus]|uniref:DUF4893 domain-containing protein n=1 Tax=Paracoccus luteus TaxID=2508543 RepID=UPI0010706543|nr:DUF4893 domain-containing protein [Paracoccus luteus]
MRNLVLLLTVLALPAAAQTAPDLSGVRPDDAARLAALDEAAGRALRQALGQGDQAQAAAAAAALRGAALPADAVDPAALSGRWTCRMTKIGGLLPAIDYPPFACEIGVRDGTVSFEKLTGSQRTRGTLHRDGDRWIYLGSTFVRGETPVDYQDFPPDIDLQAGETLPDVGVLEVMGADSARLLMPLPYRESVLNVLTLSR